MARPRVRMLLGVALLTAPLPTLAGSSIVFAAKTV
jgi:hypothetical protein